ncbi:hypothetical protein JZ751_016934, partial [Albula glossodonta]
METAMITLLLVSAELLGYTLGAEVEGPLKNTHRGTEGYFLSVWQNRLYVYSAAAVFVGIWITLKVTLKMRKVGGPVKPVLYSTAVEENEDKAKEEKVFVSVVKVFFGSQTGTAKGFAEELAEEVRVLGLTGEVIDLKDYDPEENMSNECESRVVSVFLLATYTEGTPTKNAEWFCKWLEEASTDFRYGKTYLKGMKYAVFGLGNSVYTDHYNTVSKNVDKWLWMLSGSRVMTRGEGDCNVVKSRNGSVQADFKAWKNRFIDCLSVLAKGEKSPCGSKCTNCTCKKNEKNQEQIGHTSDEMKQSSE